MERSILIVDDEAAIRDVLCQAFQIAGYKPVAVENAEEAMEKLKESAFKVMFLDLRLPGMNGVELGRLIRKEHPISCIYAMTGYASLFDLADCREAGFDDYFIKPVDLKVLLNAAHQAFEKLERWKVP